MFQQTTTKCPYCEGTQQYRGYLKTTSVGMTDIPELGDELSTKAFHLVVELNESLGRPDTAMVIGQITLVHFKENEMCGFQKLSDEQRIGKRLSDVINLSAPIMFFGIREKGDVRECFRFRSDIYDRFIGSFPDDMELCFDINARPFPNCPTDYSSTTISRDILWHDAETFIDWYIRDRAQRDGNRNFIRYTKAE